MTEYDDNMIMIILILIIEKLNLLQVYGNEGNDLHVRFASLPAASFRGLLFNQSCNCIQVYRFS